MILYVLSNEKKKKKKNLLFCKNMYENILECTLAFTPKENLNKTMCITEKLNVFAYMCMVIYVLFKYVWVFVCVSVCVLMNDLLLLILMFMDISMNMEIYFLISYFSILLKQLKL